MEVYAHGKELSCKLTSAELQQRKKDVLAVLKVKVQRREELSNGFRYTFVSSDALLDEIVDFIKTERVCCAFFTFELTIAEEIVLSITGPDGTKAFINTEMDL